MRPMGRSALADMRRTKERLEAESRAYWQEMGRRAREHRTPRPVPVMPDVKVGDVVRLVTGARVTVAKVNRKSIVSTGGVRWGVGEFEVNRG